MASASPPSCSFTGGAGDCCLWSAEGESRAHFLNSPDNQNLDGGEHFYREGAFIFSWWKTNYFGLLLSCPPSSRFVVKYASVGPA